MNDKENSKIDEREMIMEHQEVGYRTNAKPKELRKPIDWKLIWKRHKALLHWILFVLMMISIIFAISSACIIAVRQRKAEENRFQEQWENSPCATFQNTKVADLPARCLPNFPKE